MAQKKTVFPISKKFKKELFKAQIKTFSVTSNYHLSINLQAQKRLYFPSPEYSKQELLCNQ